MLHVRYPSSKKIFELFSCYYYGILKPLTVKANDKVHLLATTLTLADETLLGRRVFTAHNTSSVPDLNTALITSPKLPNPEIKYHYIDR